MQQVSGRLGVPHVPVPRELGSVGRSTQQILGSER